MRAGDPHLAVALETTLPGSLPPGRATAVFVFGTCVHRDEEIADLRVLVDGAPHRATAHGAPRPDLARRRGGFWATVPIPARPAGAVVELAVAARLWSGPERIVRLGRIAIAEPGVRPLAIAPPDAAAGLIAVCMATFDPDPDLLRAQVESLRAQTDTGWVCVVSDDGSAPARFEAMTALLGDDRRFLVSRSPVRQGFYRNFERALRLAPREAPLVALCDQDDRWHPDKLAALRAGLGGAGLVYSDQRLVDGGGRVLRETMWARRRTNHTDLAALLVANTITGAATLLRREIAELALPFPDTPGMQFHDHWLALVALAAGDVAYVDRPLYDYVQHRGAVFGEVTEGGGRERRRRGVLRGGRGAYFLGYLAREVAAEALLGRCAGRLTARKRRALERYVAADRSPVALAWLAARSLRPLAGRTETLGSESELVRGILWRWAIMVLARGPRGPWRRVCDARWPDPLSFEQRRLRRWRARTGA